MIDRAQVSDALAIVDEETESLVSPTFVDSDQFVQDGYLTEDDIEQLKTAPKSSARYQTYLAYRRRMVVRLVNAGYQHTEVAAMLGIAVPTVKADLKRVKQLYEKIATRDWAVMVEDRVMQIDYDIYVWRTYLLSPGNITLNDRLRVEEHILKLEDKKDRLLGLEKAAASQHETTTNLRVTLSLNQGGQVVPVPEAHAIEP